MRLLVGMVCNKVAFQVRKQHAARRDSRRRVEVAPDELDTLTDGISSGRVAAGRDLLREFRQRLSIEERQLADLRGAGCPWDEIATRLGGTAVARRKQLARAARRVAAELGLNEGADE
jgi:hypothetical protein